MAMAEGGDDQDEELGMRDHAALGETLGGAVDIALGDHEIGRGRERAGAEKIAHQPGAGTRREDQDDQEGTSRLSQETGAEGCAPT